MSVQHDVIRLDQKPQTDRFPGLDSHNKLSIFDKHLVCLNVADILTGALLGIFEGKGVIHTSNTFKRL